ncbi:MAG: Crp/Fnr family transcriptional regulator [Sporomusaceae bacterium]|nr:Crp/Fnr family transcriptional regulator [Sporomusaceae bacterium]
MNEMYKDQLAKALAKYAAVPEDELLKFGAIAQPVALKKNQYFIRAGEKTPWFGFVLSGVFRCYHIGQNGAEYTKHFFMENDFMTANSRSLIDNEFVQKESDYYFEALEDANVLSIEQHEKQRLTHVCWQTVFSKEIERVHSIEERRIRQLMLDDAEARYYDFLRDFPGLDKRIKQTYIASYVGISPVSLSRIKNR